MLCAVRFLLVTWVLLAYFTAWGEPRTHRYRRHKFVKDQSADNMYDTNVPLFKMLRRQVRRFHAGAHARVTLVFQTPEPVYIRWFKRAPRFNMGSSEVPNMLPVEGHPSYLVSYVTSKDVKATSLIIPSFNMSFPQDFETIITNLNGTLQYQISTMIKEPTWFDRHPVYSPEWVITPPATDKFHNNEHLKVHCRIFVPYDVHHQEKPHDVSSQVELEAVEMYINELTLNHATKNHDPRKASMKFDSVISVNRDTDNHTADYTEHKTKNGFSHIKILKRGHAIYDVKMIKHNATVETSEGIYQCAMDREQDKMYILSDITAYGWKSSMPSQYRAEILPCDGKGKHEFFRSKYIAPRLRFSKREAACFRCRGMGYPRPEVGIFDMTSAELTTSPGIGVTKYVNVKDGGVPEVTVTLHDVKHLHWGRYICKVYSNHINTQAHTQRFSVFHF